MARLDFPTGFHWGAATASYQIEGACREAGRGESIWDRFTHVPGNVRDGSTGDRACDSYHRWRDDIALLRAMGLDSYRFSIAWPRIQPTGRGPANVPGLDHYRALVDGLLEAGIRPFPTLYHWDLPQALEDAGGWPARDTAARFADYAGQVIAALGDRVRHWMIFNEPQIFTSMGYLTGYHAPGRRDPAGFLRATHVVNLAQGAAFGAMRAARGDAVIGTAFNFSPCEPASTSAADVAAAERWHRFVNEWFLGPALRGVYPEAYVGGVPAGIMGVQPGDEVAMRAPLDFVGVNLYTRTIVKAAHEHGTPSLEAIAVGPVGGHDGPRTNLGWEVWPDALHVTLVWLTRAYGRPVIEVTENGCSYGDGPGADGVVRDQRRIDFYRGYLAAVHRAIADGADVRGYHAWTLLDNFEWAEGFAQRFGLAWTDFDTGNRVLKESGHWYGRVARANALEV
jgi:beta-glucosidase